MMIRKYISDLFLWGEKYFLLIERISKKLFFRKRVFLREEKRDFRALRLAFAEITRQNFSYFIIGILSITVVFATTIFLIYSQVANTHVRRASLKEERSVEFKALPETSSKISVATDPQDGRAQALEDFFAEYESPLYPYADLIVQTADEFHLDFRLLPAIAMQESNLCQKAPPDSYNCFGFGIYKDNVPKFDSFEDAILTVSRVLSREYIAKGYTTPSEIMKKYTPQSNGSWAESVSQYMDLIYTIL